MNIVIASPHSRNSKMGEELQEKYPALRFLHVTSHKELISLNLHELSPDWIFFPHWSWKVPSQIFSEFQCVIFHMTDLPFGRGGTPLQNLILTGHKNTKICALKCEEGIDTGPVYCRRPLSLDGSAEEILSRAHLQIQDMIQEILDYELSPKPQIGQVVEFERRSASDGDLESLTDISTVYDYIRMLDAEGYPNAYLQTSHLQFDFTNVERLGEDLIANVRITRRTHD